MSLRIFKNRCKNVLSNLNRFSVKNFVKYSNTPAYFELFFPPGIRIYYTDRLRRHDTAMLLVGNEVNFLHLVNLNSTALFQ